MLFIPEKEKDKKYGEWDLREFFIDDPYEEEYIESDESDTLDLDDSDHQPPKADINKLIKEELKQSKKD